MPEEMVMTAPDTGAVETEPETSVESTETETSESVDQGDTPQEGETGHLRGAELFRAVKEKLKAAGLSAQEIKSMRNAIYIAGKADAATGGDLGAFERERAAYQQLQTPDMEGYTPEQVVEAVRDKIQFWDNFDSKFEEGSPEIISMMVENNPASFQNLAIAAMDKMAEVNNEAFSTYVAQSTLNYLKSADLPLHITLAKRFLPESSQDIGTQAVIDAFKAIESAYNGISQMAAKKIDLPKPKTAENQTQSGQDQDLKQVDVTRREWNLEAGPKTAQIRDSEMQKIAANRKATLTDKEKQDISSAVREEYNTRLQADRRYGESMQAYIRAGNRRAYVDTATSKAKLLLPAIVERHTNAILDKRPKGNGTTKPAATAKPAVQTRTSGNETWLSGSPASLGLQVDYGRTTQRMMLDNRAYIKGKDGVHRWKPRIS